MVKHMTQLLSRNNPKCQCVGHCIKELKPIQAWALYEASKVGGLLGAIGVGSGKTGLGLLMPLVMPQCQIAVILLPSGNVAQLERDHKQWSQHFRTPTLVTGDPKKIKILPKPILYILPYSQLSQAKATALLEEIQPDLIIGDEAQKLRYKDTATTSRVFRYFGTHQDTRACFWSGTLTSKSIKDYALLSALALKDGSPLPLDMPRIEEWSLAIDPGPWKAGAGALEVICQPGETLESGYYRRLTETHGVVATKASSIDASIIFEERKAPEVPDVVTDAIKQLRESWTRPDGEELVDILQVARSARELAAGFFYRWRFPKGEPDDVILTWLAVRKDWHKELRLKLKGREEHLDSPLLCANAAVRAEEGYKGDLPIWRSKMWREWVKVRDTVEPVSEAVWLSDYLVKDASNWAQKTKGVVWVDTQAFGSKMAKISGLTYHAGGPQADALITSEAGSRSIIASIKAHGTGRDGLQRLFNHQLVANPPSSGAQWEQLLGRLHRMGQEADEVVTSVYRHTQEYAEAVDSAITQARYIQGTLGTFQKLTNASSSWSL